MVPGSEKWSKCTNSVTSNVKRNEHPLNPRRQANLMGTQSNMMTEQNSATMQNIKISWGARIKSITSAKQFPTLTKYKHGKYILRSPITSQTPLVYYPQLMHEQNINSSNFHKIHFYTPGGFTYTPENSRTHRSKLHRTTGTHVVHIAGNIHCCTTSIRTQITPRTLPRDSQSTITCESAAYVGKEIRNNEELSAKYTHKWHQEYFHDIY